LNRRTPWLAAVVAIAFIATTSAGEAQTTPVCGFTVVNSYDHDPNAYTQGLVYRDGTLYEGTGLFDGDSSIRRVTLETGAVDQIHFLENQYFGEGITLVNDRLIQLTWQNQVAFIWDRASFAPLGQFPYSGQGWGLTDGAGRLIMSNGSSFITFRDSDTFDIVRQVQVHNGLDAVSNLNELEFIRGEILANVYTTNLIARIAPDTGQVIAWIDLGGLLDQARQGPEVLNGIAFDNDTGRLFVTGKFWPTLFEIELTDCPPLPLFSDDFASENTLGWSSTNPAEPEPKSD